MTWECHSGAAGANVTSSLRTFGPSRLVCGRCTVVIWNQAAVRGTPSIELRTMVMHRRSILLERVNRARNSIT